MIKNAQLAATTPELAKGQIWRLQHVYIQIVELGQRLLRYRMMDSLGQEGVRTQVSGVEVMLHYLHTRSARLVHRRALA